MSGPGPPPIPGFIGPGPYGNGSPFGPIGIVISLAWAVVLFTLTNRDFGHYPPSICILLL